MAQIRTYMRTCDIQRNIRHLIPNSSFFSAPQTERPNQMIRFDAAVALRWEVRNSPSSLKYYLNNFLRFYTPRGSYICVILSKSISEKSQFL